MYLVMENMLKIFKNLKTLYKSIILGLILIIPNISHASQNKKFYIGSGSPNAIFYPIANSLCKNFNAKQDEYLCVAKTSKGAASNLNNLHEENIEFGISQASLQQDFFNNKNYKNIIPILGLHQESFSIIAKKSSNIKSLKDLKNKNVNIGNIGSGSRIYFEEISEVLNLNSSEFAKIYEKKSSQISKLLCTGEIDAAVYLVGHPNKIFTTAIDECESELIGLNILERYKIKHNLTEFVSSEISVDNYESQNKKIKTVSIPVILSTHKNVSKDLIEKFVNISKESLMELRQENNIFNDINFELP
jgi:TRAP transporter TAXI family solute receptor